MALPSSRKAATKPPAERVPVSCGEFALRWPELTLWMTADAYPDGADRRTSTLTLMIDNGDLKVSLNDRDTEHSTVRTGDGLLDLLDTLDAALADSTVVWRKNPWAKKK